MPQRITRPARFEGPRCAIARELFQHAYAVKLAVKIAPKYHPWRRLVESAIQDLDNLTEMTLQPRNAAGIVKAASKERRRFPSVKLAMATYLVAAQFVPLLPGIVFYHGDAKIYPLKTAGIVDEPVIAPRLRVYITPKRVDIEKAPERPLSPEDARAAI